MIAAVFNGADSESLNAFCTFYPFVADIFETGAKQKIPKGQPNHRNARRAGQTGDLQPGFAKVSAGFGKCPNGMFAPAYLYFFASQRTSDLLGSDNSSMES